MIRASWGGVVLAAAPRTVRVEGNHYFPPESLSWEYLRGSGTRTVCPWKGVAHYYDLVVADGTHPDVAWTYSRPIPWIRRIRGYVAFGPGVTVERVDDTTEPKAPHTPTNGDPA
ncbi:DUF427 domain-containing protein [Lipingzhangella sp. LS1_29]|uniref:DUF427 domain-containing protein n=1 Tax=Lipingzhangella rawalii TaxID=2055835 RepID=A0ABU2HAI8_9ACTN|nr:DUF427 domain-containing protein [Lipingzhangella rawalii]MDS1271860.1 DUF427 domain-containing protein [Lipingzhangella rawalii]